MLKLTEQLSFFNLWDSTTKSPTPACQTKLLTQNISEDLHYLSQIHGETTTSDIFTRLKTEYGIGNMTTKKNLIAAASSSLLLLTNLAL